MKPVPKPSLVALYDHFGLTVAGPDRGGWTKAQCPLPDHDDKNPSASLNEDECRWRCHACDESGDGMDLIMRRTGARWADALRIAESFADSGDAPVRAESGSSSLLPRSTGHRPGRSNWTPPWIRG